MGPAAELTNMCFCLLPVTALDLNFVLVAFSGVKDPVPLRHFGKREVSQKFCNFPGYLWSNTSKLKMASVQLQQVMGE